MGGEEKEPKASDSARGRLGQTSSS
jgi:hypothetical protein